jgi:hypothetical protein
MKETLFYFGVRQIHEENGNYVILSGESMIIGGVTYYVTSVMHNLDTEYKIVVVTNIK